MTEILQRIEGMEKQRVVTVTLNPVLDRALWIRGFRAGKTVQVEKSSTVAGGKGVNVSRALLLFGIKSCATGIMAREERASYTGLLHSERIDHDFHLVEGRLRTNITILSDSTDEETHIRDRGPCIVSHELERFEKKLSHLVDGRTFVVFAGSIPDGLPNDAYRRLIHSVQKEGNRAALDASGPPLKEGLEAAPVLIKPNEEETRDALGFFPRTEKEIRDAAHAFFEMGVSHCMISCGKRGLYFCTPQECIRARVAVETPVNSVGSGDAALAGGLIGILCGLGAEMSARLACAMGAANTLVSGACVLNKDDVEKLYSRVKVTRVA
jgi:1-phosphofructokinase family hexose kinase